MDPLGVLCASQMENGEEKFEDNKATVDDPAHDQYIISPCTNCPCEKNLEWLIGCNLEVWFTGM